MDRTRKSGDKPVRDDREARLAEALRQNLKRRKDQARRRKAADTDRTGPEKPSRN